MFSVRRGFRASIACGHLTAYRKACPQSIKLPIVGGAMQERSMRLVRGFLGARVLIGRPCCPLVGNRFFLGNP